MSEKTQSDEIQTKSINTKKAFRQSNDTIKIQKKNKNKNKMSANMQLKKVCPLTFVLILHIPTVDTTLIDNSYDNVNITITKCNKKKIIQICLTCKRIKILFKFG